MTKDERSAALRLANPKRKCSVCGVRPVTAYSNGLYFCDEHRETAQARAEFFMTGYKSAEYIKQYPEGVGTWHKPKRGRQGMTFSKGKGWSR